MLEILQVIWLVLVSVLFIGFFVLEGIDYGVGALYMFLGKESEKREGILHAIGPVWATNQVWLITAGGAMFAAFPAWYATMFSSYYIALVLMIVALIIRGIVIEYRSKVERSTVKVLDILMVISNFVLMLLWGVVMGNSFQGIPVGEGMHYEGNFFNLLTPYSVLGGLTTISYFLSQGSIFLSLKGPLETVAHAQKMAKSFVLLTLGIGLLFGVYTYIVSSGSPHLLNHSPYFFGILTLVLVVVSYLLVSKKHFGWAIVVNSLVAAMAVITYVYSAFPYVLLSSLSKDYHLSIANTSSSLLTLKIMLGVVVVCLPIVLIYIIWTYYVFRKRPVSGEHY